MNGLRTLREAQTLASGSWCTCSDTSTRQRTGCATRSSPPRDGTTRRASSARRDTTETGGNWTTSDLGAPSRVPNFAYSDRSGAQELLVLAFVQRGSLDLHYRLWVGAQDHLVRRYVTMALGHYMTGAYADFDAAIEVAAPP